MKNKSSYIPGAALGLLIYAMSNYTFANTQIPSESYPTYTNASLVPPSAQIPMQALWLHLNANHIGNVVIPKSFDVNGYWNYMTANNQTYQLYRKSHDNGTCNVTPDHSNDATIERAMQQQGLDIYDGAVWQIALALAAKNNPALYTQDVEGYKNFLVNGVEGGFLSYYAFKGYTYNGKTMPSAKNAFLLKFISPSWANNYDAINDCNMQWPEWSAVTGEEAWAVLIGPVQSIYLLNDGAHNSNWSASSQAGDYIQLGKNALGAIQQMQAPSGGVYRNVALPGQPQDFEISLENNFSLYAGLSMLEQALKDRDKIYGAELKSIKLNNTNNIATQQATLKQVLNSDQDDINTINKIKKGMVRFFAGLGGVTVFDKTGNYFYSSVNGTQPNTTDFAVDVQTWGATVIASIKKDPNDANDPNLEQAMVDAYGKDMMYNILISAITKGAYKDANNNLLGVGYTTQKPTDNFYELSAEWTLGAINTAIVLADYYKDDPAKSITLISHAQKMLRGVTAEASSLQGSPKSPTARLSYLYANKRALIPFGWFSNKMPATASTAWSLMVNSCFNPLELGGGNYQTICRQLNLGE